MDPFSVIVMLAIHLVASGGLMFIVWRLMPDAPGLCRWAMASTLFGLGYLARLFFGMQTVDLIGVASDGVMLLAVLLFSEGLREFSGSPLAPRHQRVALWVLVFAAQASASVLGGVLWRHIGINLATGSMYAVMTWSLVLEIRRQPLALHAPLRLLAAMIGGLGALTLLRAYSIATEGMAVAFKGVFAQAFYIYASLAAVVVAMTMLWLMFLRLNGRLAELATRDALTGVYNRNGLDRALQQHFARRDAPPLTLVLVDIDHFKRINDTQGHAAGDAMLKAVATALLAQLRAGDFVARIGGEEFLIGCVGAPDDVALPLAQRLRSSVGRLQVLAADSSHPVACTVSVGVSAGFSSYAGWEAAALQADQALYEMKASGRDGVRPFVAA
ncbi:MAG: GGDEF domain-containing protein [Rhizobacter sp.]|nr:GGDEF domain-containing protein [Rhizobacter sp.]